METSFDLDVSNYSINDLIHFFKLKDNYDTKYREYLLSY